MKYIELFRGHVVAGGYQAHEGCFSFRDTLTCGPVSADPTLHDHLRKKYWLSLLPNDSQSEFSSSLSDHAVLSAAVSRSLGASLPFLVWTSPNCADRLFLWWIVASLRFLQTDLPVWVASYTESATSVIISRSELAGRRRCARLQCREELDLAAGYWALFAGRPPDEVSREMLAHGGDITSAELGVADVYDVYVKFFPLMSGLHYDLSALDSAILGCFDSQSYRGVKEVWRNGMDLSYVPDGIIRQRLQSWCLGTPTVIPALHSQLGAQRETRRVDAGYRLTPHGESLLRGLTTTPIKAPSWKVGSIDVFEPMAKWVLLPSGEIVTDPSQLGSCVS